jgi:LPXTG-motif cell wall-anchored protein
VCLAATAAVAQDRTYTLNGTVVEVDGNTLVVKMDTGEARMFTPPADRRFLIDGKELTLSQLQPGTKLTAQVKETTSTVTDRTVDSLEGTVFYAAGPTVILTLSTRERRQFQVKSGDPVKFYDHNGKEITVFDLRKNMSIKATKITEAPRVELVQNIAVTGTAPMQAAAAAPAAAAPKPAAAAQPAAAPASQTASTSGAGGEAKTLPKTASSLPLLGLIGIVSLVVALGLTVARRR